MYTPTDDQLDGLCSTAQFSRCPIYIADFERFLASCRREAERAVG
jgi:hypothetical protein